MNEKDLHYVYDKVNFKCTKVTYYAIFLDLHTIKSTEKHWIVTDLVAREEGEWPSQSERVRIVNEMKTRITDRGSAIVNLA